MTGTYDPELDTLYWPTGNPGPDLIGDDRLGDNLYSDSIVALDPKTGELKWHFQFTPHDVWDYDAQEPPALIDANWQGQPRKLLVQANRNGFLLRARSHQRRVPARHAVREERDVGIRSRPRKGARSVPNMEPTPEGRRVCPSLEGASNWYSDFVQSGHRPVLRADQRQVRRLHENADGVGGRQGLHGRFVHAGARRTGAARAARNRHPDRQTGMGASAVGPGQIVGRREPPRAAWSSSATTAAR